MACDELALLERGAIAVRGCFEALQNTRAGFLHMMNLWGVGGCSRRR